MKIPEYNSQQNMTLDTPKVEVNTQVAGQQGRSMQEMGKGFSALGEQFGKLRDQTEINQKKLELAQNIDQIEKEAIDNPDPFKAMDDANSKAKKALSAASSGITSPALKAEYELEAGLHMQAKLSSLNNVLRRKQIDKSSSTLLQLNDKHEQDFYTASTPKEQALAKDFIKLNTEKMVKLGGMSNEQGYKYLEKKFSDMRVGEWEHKIAVDPAGALNSLNSGEGKDLTQQERDTLIAKAKTGEQRFENEQRRDEIDFRLQTMNDIFSGKLDASSKSLASNIAAKDPILAEAIQKVNESGDYFPEEIDNQPFADLTKDVFDANSSEEISNYLLKVIKNQTGTISKDRMAILVDAAMKRANGLKKLETDPEKPLSPQQVSYEAGMKNIVNNGNKRINKANVISNYSTAVNSGKSPEEALTEATQTEIKRINPVSSKYKVGDVITNKLGEQAEVYAFDSNGTPLLKRVKKEKVNAE